MFGLSKKTTDEVKDVDEPLPEIAVEQAAPAPGDKLPDEATHNLAGVARPKVWTKNSELILLTRANIAERNHYDNRGVALDDLVEDHEKISRWENTLIKWEHCSL